MQSYSAKRGAAAVLILLLLLMCIPLGASAALYAPLAQEPQLVQTLYPTDDVVVADIVLTQAPYLADNSGGADVTQIIQTALNDCYAAGGGTVFLPAGQYHVTGPITVPAFVTLRGDWQDPDVSTEYGTMILADVPSADTPTPALFTVGGSAGAMGLTVYYPNQSLENVRPYPFTFYVAGGGEDFMLQSIVNCTVINGYRGLGVCVEGGGHEMLTVENFKGTFLSVGAQAYNQSDVGTWKNISIGNHYWAQGMGSFARPDAAALAAYTKNHTTGLILGDLEWTQFANLSIAGCKTGIHIVKGQRIEFAGILFGVDIRNCETGLLIDSIDERWGMAVAKGVISGTSSVLNNSKGYVKLADVAIEGKKKGNVQCSAMNSADFILNGQHATKPIEQLFVVRTDNNRQSDISSVLQQTIDQATAQGGGVVYLPAGRYLLQNPITVPAGVELRGSSSVATREQVNSSRGTLLYADYGRCTSEQEADAAQALITLAGENAGIRGIRFVYPNSIFTNGVLPYSYTIRGTASGVYAVNICFVGSYNGVDFRGCDNHLIKKLVGVCYRNTMAVGGKNGLIEGCLQNANIAFRNDFQIDGWPQGEEKLFDTLINPITRKMSNIIRISDSEGQTVLNTFAYGAQSLVINNGGRNVRLINVGADNLLEDSPLLQTTGGSLTAVNVMRYNGVSYSNNGTQLTMYNRLTINQKFEPALDDSISSKLLNWLAELLNNIRAFIDKINPF